MVGITRSKVIFCMQAAAGKIGAAIRRSPTRWQAGEVFKVWDTSETQGLKFHFSLSANHGLFLETDSFLLSM